MNLNELKKLLEIDNKCYELFKKRILIENILEEYKNIEIYINLVAKKWFESWIDNTLSIEIKYDYINLKCRILALNIEALRSEYKIVYELNQYSKSLGEIYKDKESLGYDGSTTSFKGIIEWIENQENCGTLEELKESLEDDVRNC